MGSLRRLLSMGLSPLGWQGLGPIESNGVRNHMPLLSRRHSLYYPWKHGDINLHWLISMKNENGKAFQSRKCAPWDKKKKPSSLVHPQLGKVEALEWTWKSQEPGHEGWEQVPDLRPLPLEQLPTGCYVLSVITCLCCALSIPIFEVLVT